MDPEQLLYDDDPRFNMDSEQASHDDHGMTSGSELPSNDDPGANFGLEPATHDGTSANPGLEPGPHEDLDHPGTSSSSQNSSSTTRSNIRCVNCGLNVTRMRRHPLEVAEARVHIQHWVSPQQVTSDDFVCHSCWTLVWNEILSNQQSTGTVGHRRVCVSCGCSLLRARSHQLCSNSERESRIRNVIIRQIAPQQLPETAYICHTCWVRSDRAANRARSESSFGESDQEPQPEIQQNIPDTSTSIVLPNYARAGSTQSRCFFPGCNESNRLIVPSQLRVQLFCDYNFYVPPGCRICYNHLRSNSWDLLYDIIENPIQSFSATQIEEFASLLKDNMNKHMDFENIANIPDHVLHYYLGFTRQQFDEILTGLPRLSNKHRGAFALAAYLMKLRTGDTDERMSELLQVPRSTLERLMNMAREIINQDFVPRNLGLNHISRAEIAQRNLLIPNSFYGGDERRPIVIMDGTYIYIEKSSNYLYQKSTYSLHKFRNLVKPFLMVCTDGYIIDVLGPYPATMSDAEIINNEFGNENNACRQYFQDNDVFILDRGFRDSLPLLEQCNYEVHVPLSPEDGESQLSTINANRSRKVTMCRWVVEVVNGIFKKSFKLFRQNYFNRASSHLMIDFAIAAALVNQFHTKLRDRDDARQIVEEVNRNMYINNDLSDFVQQRNLNRVRASFVNINVNTENVTEFPRLTLSELILIACGTYQLKEARSYYGEHIRFNGCYRIEVCSDRRNSLMLGAHFGPNCSLLRAKIQSRHVSRRLYFVYILLNSNATGRAAITRYCCNCIVGRRTVGCCAHVMSVLWYLGWARHETNINPPAQFLDGLLITYEDNAD